MQITIGGSFSVLLGRAQAEDKVYSPDILPGYNKEELEEQGTELH
ncbi:hypothetical protein [Merismopedia glauca]|nr:hypothetical protein [Merismopedia glauca]